MSPRLPPAFHTSCTGGASRDEGPKHARCKTFGSGLGQGSQPVKEVSVGGFPHAGGAGECGGVGGLAKDLLSSLLGLQTNVGGSAVVPQGLAGGRAQSWEPRPTCARGSQSSGWLEECFVVER